MHLPESESTKCLLLHANNPSGRSGILNVTLSKSLQRILPGAFHVCTIASSFGCSILNTHKMKTGEHFDLSRPLKTQLPTARSPALYFLFANLDSSISTTPYWLFLWLCVSLILCRLGPFGDHQLQAARGRWRMRRWLTQVYSLLADYWWWVNRWSQPPHPSRFCFIKSTLTQLKHNQKCVTKLYHWRDKWPNTWLMFRIEAIPYITRPRDIIGTCFLKRNTLNQISGYSWVVEIGIANVSNQT